MTARRFFKLIFTCFALLGGSSPLVALAASGTEPLLQQSDLSYQGAFRLPFGATDQTTFAYGGSGLTYNPANNSLFMLGHVYHQWSAEFNIPTVINSTDINDLETAILLQPFTDTTDGNKASVGLGKVYVAGQLVYGNRLIGSAYTQDDTSQVESHFTSTLDLSLNNDFQGFYQVGTVGPRFVSGYMSKIPQGWQTDFGGPAITGGCCNTPDVGATNVGNMSWGPSAFVFDPDDLGVVSPTPATPLVYYTQGHPTLGGWGSADDPNPQFNLMTIVAGAVFPKETRTVLFFGRTGTGDPCYGDGTDNPALHKQPHATIPGAVYCYDPLEVGGGQGPHAYPYAYYVWAYDALDLLSAKNGNIDPWDVTPYASWTLSLPFDSDRRTILGAAYDSTTDSIYISQGNGDVYGMPVIHVFKVEKGNTPPQAQCEDGIDNDSDGLIDLADPGCSNAQDDDEFNQPPPAAQCADGIDNDSDGLTDLADPGCSNAQDDDEFNPPPPAAQCADGIDNDSDGLIDLADPGCSNAQDDDEFNQPPPAAQCADGIDNDSDGLTDLADPGCSNAQDNNEFNQPPPAAQCADGIDNDSDGLIDLADPGCSNAQDNDEFNQPPPVTQCADGIDNDSDGLTDLADPGCSNAQDNDEFNQPPPASQCVDGIDNDSDGHTDLTDPGCSDISDDNESDDPSQSNTTESESASLGPFTLLLLLCAFVVLRRRAGVI